MGTNILYRCVKTGNNMDDGEKEKGVWGDTCQSIYCTLSQVTWVSHIKIYSFTSIGTALLYTKSITRG